MMIGTRKTVWFSSDLSLSGAGVSRSSSLLADHTHTHTYTHMYIQTTHTAMTSTASVTVSQSSSPLNSATAAVTTADVSSCCAACKLHAVGMAVVTSCTVCNYSRCFILLYSVFKPTKQSKVTRKCRPSQKSP